MVNVAGHQSDPRADAALDRFEADLRGRRALVASQFREMLGGAEDRGKWTDELAMRVGTFARTFAWLRQRDYLPEDARPGFDPMVLRRALAATLR